MKNGVLSKTQINNRLRKELERLGGYNESKIKKFKVAVLRDDDEFYSVHVKGNGKEFELIMRKSRGIFTLSSKM
jgi:hypothetical protein